MNMTKAPKLFCLFLVLVWDSTVWLMSHTVRCDSQCHSIRVSQFHSVSQMYVTVCHRCVSQCHSVSQYQMYLRLLQAPPSPAARQAPRCPAAGQSYNLAYVTSSQVQSTTIKIDPYLYIHWS